MITLACGGRSHGHTTESTSVKLLYLLVILRVCSCVILVALVRSTCTLELRIIEAV